MAVIRAVTIPPGENTGWHYHPVPVRASVLSGTLTRVLEDGTVETTGPGQSIIERPRQRHIGHNVGPDPVEVLLESEEAPDGGPLAVPAESSELGAAAELGMLAQMMPDRCITSGFRERAG
jgi:quercetin dioxygenase-like cupin family protein